MTSPFRPASAGLFYLYVFDDLADEADDTDALGFGTFKAHRRVERIDGLELNKAMTIDDALDKALIIDEHDGELAAFHAVLLNDADDVAVLNLGIHAIALDLDTDGVLSFALAQDEAGQIIDDVILGLRTEACGDRFIDGDDTHTALGSGERVEVGTGEGSLPRR